MNFVYPWVLIFLLMLPVIASVAIRSERQQKGFGFPSTSPLSGFAWNRGNFFLRVPLYLRLGCLAALIIAAARPLGPQEPGKRHVEGLDIVLTLDTSQSMLAMDFQLEGKRQNRLDVVKRVVEDFISKRSDDRIGLVVFGSQAFTQSPLTLDHQVLLQFLRLITIGMAGPETAIGDGLGTAIKRIKDVPAPSKVVILLTDGDNTAGAIDPLEAAKLAKTLGIRVYTIAVGTNEPVPFPVQGFFGTEYRSQIIRVNTEALQKIAEETQGKFFLAKDTETLQKVYDTIDKLEKTRKEAQDPVVRKELAWPFLLIALSLLVCEQIWLLTPWRVIP